ncbi:hypothetical protein Lesp02_04680 [Lentzea sp. NBRC 105346]|uniref:hypothetical protein n=1 Tax=Lentzea sp. NBRC 105346 TaxID=3032205 RepID=UPI0024A3B385|nr:hypothetical protein [Lentzea sp. NBRC 105346]GLZ28278.1 hypothetical protein Lesp02_04680 [Lentzea sp. NBRC 105346]
MTELPPYETLPDHVRARARARIAEGMTGQRRPVWRAPLTVAAGITTLAVAAVFTGQALWNPAPLAKQPPAEIPQLQGPDLAQRYQVQRDVPAPIVERCGAARLRPVSSASAKGITLAVFASDEGRVFCAVTATTVTVSPPTKTGLGTAPARLLFTAPNGAMAGLVREQTGHLSLRRTDDAGVSAMAAVVGDVFLAPEGFAGADRGVRFLVDGDEVPADIVPPVTPAVTDRPLPPGERESDAGKRLAACLREQDNGIADPDQFVPGAHAVLGTDSEVQVASFGELFLECRVRDGVAPVPQAAVVDLESHRTLRLHWYFYDFKPSEQGGDTSDRRAFTGQVIDQRVAKITLSRPGVPDQTAEIANGTFVVPGPVPFDVESKITAWDADGVVLEEISLRE